MKRFILRYIVLPIAAFVLGWSLYVPAHAGAGAWAGDAGAYADKHKSCSWAGNSGSCAGDGNE